MGFRQWRCSTAGIRAATVVFGFMLLVSACGPGVNGDPGAPAATASGPQAKGTEPAEGNPAPLASSSLPLTPHLSPGEQSARPAGILAVPEWMAKDLASPDVQVRLKAAETWGQQRQSRIDPLMLALNDPDERVRARALELLEQDWVYEQAVLNPRKTE